MTPTRARRRASSARPPRARAAVTPSSRWESAGSATSSRTRWRRRARWCITSIPTKEMAMSQSNASWQVDLSMHTENAFHPLRPDFVAALLRARTGERAGHPARADRRRRRSSHRRRRSRCCERERFGVHVVDSYKVEGEDDLELPVRVLNGSVAPPDRALARDACAVATRRPSAPARPSRRPRSVRRSRWPCSPATCSRSTTSAACMAAVASTPAWADRIAGCCAAYVMRDLTPLMACTCTPAVRA